MPHRKLAGDDRLDARLEHSLGRLFFEGHLTPEQYTAGMRYAQIALKYLECIEAPEPYGGDARHLADDVCYQRTIHYAQARTVLRSAGKRCAVAVDRVAIYGEPLRGSEELGALRAGLKALSGE